jgi:hypothetical protein
LTFALPDMPASPESLGFKGVKDQKILSDYDPFADV